MLKIGSGGFSSVKTLLIIVISVVFTAFVLQNSAIVEIQFLFWRLTMSRVILLIGALASGFVIGFLAGWEVFGRKKAGPGTEKTGTAGKG